MKRQVGLAGRLHTVKYLFQLQIWDWLLEKVWVHQNGVVNIKVTHCVVVQHNGQWILHRQAHQHYKVRGDQRCINKWNLYTRSNKKSHFNDGWHSRRHLDLEVDCRCCSYVWKKGFDYSQCVRLEYAEQKARTTKIRATPTSKPQITWWNLTR